MRLLILGSGVSGRAAATLAMGQGHAVTVFDEGRPDPGELLKLGVGLVTGAWDRGLLAGVDLVVASPGFSERSLPVVETLESGVPIWSELEFAWRALAEDRQVIAITGTNGKTTVTETTTRMLADSGIQAISAGNIGVAFSTVVDQDWSVAVVEASSFQLRFVDRFRPRAAVVLNVASDHLDWHGSAQAYAAAKARIFERQTAEDLLVFGADDTGATELASRASSRRHPVSATRLPEGGSGVAEGRLQLPGMSIPLRELGSDDPAHVVDVAASAVVALEMGADTASVADVARRFSPGAHRRTVVETIAGVTYVDDSKATNPHAALAAVEAYDSVVLIAGGLAKGLDLLPLAEAGNVRLLIGLGTEGPNLAAAAGERGRSAASMEQAVEMAAELALPGDTVLLAPGGASFDQFDSYGARGDAFVAAVAGIKENTMSTKDDSSSRTA